MCGAIAYCGFHSDQVEGCLHLADLLLFHMVLKSQEGNNQEADTQ
jgi:hypothetical protein